MLAITLRDNAEGYEASNCLVDSSTQVREGHHRIPNVLKFKKKNLREREREG